MLPLRHCVKNGFSCERTMPHSTSAHAGASLLIFNTRISGHVPIRVCGGSNAGHLPPLHQCFSLFSRIVLLAWSYITSLASECSAIAKKGPNTTFLGNMQKFPMRRQNPTSWRCWSSLSLWNGMGHLTQTIPKIGQN